MPRTTPRGYRTPLLNGEGSDVKADMDRLADDIDADVTDHENSKTGVHGIPAMAAGQVPVWDGANWVATNVATQDELDTVNNALDARLDVLESMGRVKLTGPSNNVVPVGTQSFSWTEAGEGFDVGGLHGAPNLERITIPAGMGGLWRVEAKMKYTVNAGGSGDGAVFTRLVKNATLTEQDQDYTSFQAWTTAVAGDITNHYVLALQELVPGDFFVLRGQLTGSGQLIASGVFQAYRIDA